MDRHVHLVGFATERDEQLREAVEERQPHAHLDQLVTCELGLERGAHVRRGWATDREEGVGELQRQLQPRRQRRRRVRVVDEVDLILTEPLLPRDREADVASIPAIGDARIAQAHRFLARVIEHAVRPELAVRGGERRSERRLMGEDRAERGRSAGDGAGKARHGAHSSPPSAGPVPVGPNTFANLVNPSTRARWNMIATTSASVYHCASADTSVSSTP